MHKWLAKTGLAAILAAGATVTSAQTCGGFTDVSPANVNTCNAVEWVKNRSVTLGCTSTTAFCPLNDVTREQMALFMQRLGTALTPELLGAQGAADAPTPIPNDTPGEVALVDCQTSISAATNYPRKAVVVGSFSGLADANPAAFRAFLLVSVNGGFYQNFIPGGSAAMRATLAPNGWGTVTATEVLSLDAGSTYRFAMAVRRDNLTGLGGTLARYRCQVTANITNRQGATSPF